MKVVIDIHPSDAKTFVKYLNDDEGIRESAVRQLLSQNKPSGIEQMTAIVGCFGRISKGFMEALEQEKLLDQTARAQVAKELAGLA